MKNTSTAQWNANRENARHSTGPKSAEGKRKVALNPLIHGFAGQTCLIPASQQEAYTKHFQDFRDEYKPKGPTEEFLVQSMSELTWSAQQIRAQITNLMAIAGTKSEPLLHSGDDDVDFAIAQASALEQLLPKINLLGIYEQRKMRLFRSTRKDLVEVQAERKAAENEELAEAAQIRQSSPRDWQPAEDGFACSLHQIDRYIARNQRLTSTGGGSRR